MDALAVVPLSAVILVICPHCNSHKAILAREALYEFCCSFLKTAYDPFMRSIKVGPAQAMLFDAGKCTSLVVL